MRLMWRRIHVRQMGRMPQALDSITAVQSICDRHSLGTPVEGDIPISQDISSKQTRIASLLNKNNWDDTNGIKCLQICTRKRYRTGVLTTNMRRANCCNFESIAGLKKFAIGRKGFADCRYRCTSVQQCPHFSRFRNLQTDSSPVLDNITWIHHSHVNARAWIHGIERIPRQFNATHTRRWNIRARLSKPALRESSGERQTSLAQPSRRRYTC